MPSSTLNVRHISFVPTSPPGVLPMRLEPELFAVELLGSQQQIDSGSPEINSQEVYVNRW